MTRDDRKQFIVELCDGMRDAILRDIDRIPAHWDGIELRLLVARKAQENASFSFVTKDRCARFDNDALVSGF